MTKLQNILVAMYKLDIVNIIIILTVYWFDWIQELPCET